MDAFRTLTGGSTFDRKRFAGDMNHFQKQAPLASTSAAAAAPSLPAELDFFASSSSAPAPSKKRKRTAATAAATATAAELPATDTQHDYAALLRKHKIKLTGLDLPEPVASINDLVARRTKSQQDDTSTNDAVKRIANNWRALGYKEPTGVQMAAWGTMLAGRDILACAPTGSGKTYSFILPLLVLLPPSLPPPPSSSSSAGAAFPQSSSSSPDDSDKVIRPRAVVIEPTRELSIQVLREARKLAAGPGGGDQSAPARAWKIAVLGEEGVGVPVAAQKGRGKKKNKKGKGTDGKKKEKKQEEEEDAVDAEKGGKDNAGTAESEAEEEEDERPTTMEATAEEGDTAAQQPYYGPVDILITTPLRLVFALKSNLVSLASTQHLILDEADKLFELNFLEQTDEILAACKRSAPGGEGEVRKGMFSATMPSTVEELAKGVMAGAGAGMVRAIVGHKEAATTTIDQSLLFVNREDHKLLSLRSLITSGQFTPPVLIFVQSIQRAKELANELVFDGINADAIHADRSASERDEVVRRFAEGQVWCLICTDVMARGVDFKGVKLVINYDFPQSAMSYIHRIGRTGRAGKAGRAITFFSKADAGHLKTIVNVMRASGCSVPDWMVALPNPSQNSKKQLKQRPIGRKDISRTLGAGALDDADEGARKGTGAGKKRGGGGGGKDGEHKAGGQGPKHKKQRIMSGVGSGFAGASAGGRGKATEQDAGAANGSRKNAAAAGQKKASKGGGKASASERPAAAKKAKREVALDE